MWIMIERRELCNFLPGSKKNLSFGAFSIISQYYNFDKILELWSENLIVYACIVKIDQVIAVFVTVTVFLQPFIRVPINTATQYIYKIFPFQHTL